MYALETGELHCWSVLTYFFVLTKLRSRLFLYSVVIEPGNGTACNIPRLGLASICACLLNLINSSLL